MVFNLFPLQKRAVKSVVKELRGAPRTTLVLPTGTGKTLVALHVTKQLKAKTVLILQPAISLVDQCRIQWKRYSEDMGIKISFACITSDETVVSDHVKNADIDVTIVTYHSLKNLKLKVDLMIADEAHATAGTDAERPFSMCLLNRYVRPEKRLFMTATRKVILPRDNRVFSMDNEELYGRVACDISPKEAMAAGVIMPYDVVIADVGDKKIREIILQNNIVFSEDIKENLRSNILVTVAAVGRALMDGQAKKVAVFFNTVTASKLFVEVFQKCFHYPIAHLDGKINIEDRNAILSDIRKSSSWVVSNVRCLSTGVDLPEMDSVVFGDKRFSYIDVTQIIGRVLRLHPEKKRAKVILPMVTPDNASSDKISETYFEAIRYVCRFLYDSDSSIIEYIRAAGESGESSATLGTGGSLIISRETSISIPEVMKGLSLRMVKHKDLSSIMPWPELKAIVAPLNLKSKKDYGIWLKDNAHLGILSRPDQAYREWVSWPDFFGKDRRPYVTRSERRPWEQFVKELKKQKIKGVKDYESRLNEFPSWFPANPPSTYKEQWLGWDHFTARKEMRVSREKKIIKLRGLGYTILEISKKVNLNPVHTAKILKRLGLTGNAERYISLDGKKLTLKQWAHEKDLPIKCIRSRLYTLKWSVRKTLTTPKRKFLTRSRRR